MTPAEAAPSQFDPVNALAVTTPPVYKSQTAPNPDMVQIPPETVAVPPICIPSINKLTTSPFVPVPLTDAEHSNIGFVDIVTVFVDLVFTTNALEAGLKAKHELDAFAVIVLPKAILIPDEAVQVPFARTVVGAPSAVPFSKTCILVPAASFEVPETVVTADDTQIGPFTVGVNACLCIILVAIAETHNPDRMACTDTV